MIIDKIGNHKQYSKLGKKIALALEYLRNTDFAHMANGRHDIDGNEMYVLISDYLTKDCSECKIEAHRKYVDVQYVIKGKESVGYAPLDGRPSITEYDDKNDYILFTGDVSLIELNEGMFAIFYPEDLHMPGVGKTKSSVRKAVVKVKI